MAWKRLCSLADVAPCSLGSFTIDGIGFLVVRGDERFIVVPPFCPHMSAPLADGFFDGHLLTCALHLWQWSASDGSAQGIAEAPLMVYPSKVADGDICVNFDEELQYKHQW